MSSASWRLVLDTRAAQDLKKLRRQHHPHSLPSQLVQAIDALPHHPEAGKLLKGDKRGSRSLRVRDLRLIYDLSPAEQTIHRIRIGGRKDVYR